MEVLDLNPIIQVGTRPGPMELVRSSTVCFWRHFITSSLAGQPTAKIFKYTSPDTPSQPLLFLGEARGSDWGHILGVPNKGGASCIRHLWEAVSSFRDFTADVMGAIGVAGVTGGVVVLCAVGSVNVVGDVGATGDTGVMGAPGVMCVTVAMGAICVAGTPGVTGDVSSMSILGAVVTTGVTGASVVTGISVAMVSCTLQAPVVSWVLRAS